MLLPIVLPGERPERRRRPRLKLAYSVRLRRPGASSRIEAKTENVSCEGFIFVTESLFSPREVLECELVIPGEAHALTTDHDIVLRCRAEVVRVVPQATGCGFRVACRLADYTVAHQIPEEDGLGSRITFEQVAYAGEL